MDKQHSVAGVGGTIRIGVREFRLMPLTLGDLAELKAHVVSLRKSPLEALAENLGQFEPKHHAEMIRIALREACRRSERQPGGNRRLFANVRRLRASVLAHGPTIARRTRRPLEGRRIISGLCRGTAIRTAGEIGPGDRLRFGHGAGGKLFGPGSNDDRSGVQWARLYRHLSLAYGWTPTEINGLTPLQVYLYLHPDVSEFGRATMMHAEALAYRRTRRQGTDVAR